MKKTFKPLEVYAIVVTVVLVLLLGLVGSGRLDVTSYQPNLATQAYNYEGWAGSGTGSAFADTSGGLLDHLNYVASWSPNLKGQQINLQGFINPPTVSLCGWPDLIGYRVELYEPSGPQMGWNTILQGNNGGSLVDAVNRPGVDDWKNPNFLPGQLLVYQTGITGGFTSGPIAMSSTYAILQSPDGKTVIPEGSVVHADFWAHMNSCLGPGTGWVRMSSDEAWVHTGIGTVSWDRDPALYQIGDRATCSWQVGYIGGGQSWYVSIASFAQGGTMTIYPTGPGTPTTIQAATVAQSNVSSQVGSISYTVQPSDWAPNLGKLYCILRNNLYSKDFVVAGTVDNTSLAPSITSVSISPQSPKQGNTVTVSWKAAPNPVTKAAIAKIEVIYGWGGPQNDVLVPGNATSYSFTAAQSGYVRVAVAAWDSAGRPSGFRNVNVQIDAQPPLGGSNANGPGSGLGLLALIFLLVGLGVLLAGLYVVKNPVWRLPFLGVGGVLSFVGVLLGFLALISWLKGVVP